MSSGPSDRNERLQEIAKRKDTIVKTITEQEKMTAELQKRIDDCWDLTTLEDIYLPFKPKRRTRAQVAREQGLEPLAQILLLQREPNPERAAARFVGNAVRSGSAATGPATVADALRGAQDIIAEQVSSLRPHGLGPARLLSVHGDSPGKNTGVGYHALLQGIFPIQVLNPGLHTAGIFFTG